jgi:hypothetical protein
MNNYLSPQLNEHKKKKTTKYDVGKSRERHKNMEVLNQ